MQGILYEEHSAWLFVLITVIMGGAASWQMGRALAKIWKPFVLVPVYVALLNCAVRFVHFALFEGTLLSFHFYAVDYVVLFILAYIGWRMQRTAQMSSQYAFAFKAAGPFAWRRKS